MHDFRVRRHILALSQNVFRGVPRFCEKFGREDFTKNAVMASVLAHWAMQAAEFSRR